MPTVLQVASEPSVQGGPVVGDERRSLTQRKLPWTLRRRIKASAHASGASAEDSASSGAALGGRQDSPQSYCKPVRAVDVTPAVHGQ